MINKKITLAIKKGLDFIENENKKDVFLGFKTPFVAILIWQGLNTIENIQSKEIVNQGVKKLIREKSKNWSFNYWLKNSEKYKNEPYPDDLDDTFCALNVIYNCNQKLIKGEDLAKITNLLINCEKKIGGPYKTWLISNDKEEKWSDVDLAVNCNIGYFLKSLEIELKNINRLLEKAIEEKNLTSPYYKGIWPIIYFAARFYKGRAKTKLIKIIYENLSDKNSPMEMAITLSSLIRLGDKKNDTLKKLANQILEIDECQNEDFYFYVDGNKKYIGSKALTIALVIEALNLYKQRKQLESKKKINNKIKKEIINETKQCFFDLKPGIKKQFDQILQKIIDSENVDVILMSPLAVAKSIKKTNKIDEKFLIKLGVINALGWMAYTIYDDLIDDDKQIKWLSLANIICRKMDIMFTQLLPDEKGFLEEYQKVMNNLEEANYWEMENCRGEKEIIPDFSKIENLSDRSMGHALTSMAVFYKSQTSKKDKLKLKTFFQYFLAAKQMNDDAHDWESDLKKGQINSAGAELLKLTSERKNYDELKLIFWEEVFDKYAKEIMNYCQMAKKTIRQISCLKNYDAFDRMVNKVIKSTQLALDKKKETISFINSYYQK